MKRKFNKGLELVAPYRNRELEARKAPKYPVWWVRLRVRLGITISITSEDTRLWAWVRGRGRGNSRASSRRPS